jgi:hypothetical protein
MAFEADERIIERYPKTKLEEELPVVPDFACQDVVYRGRMRMKEVKHKLTLD